MHVAGKSGAAAILVLVFMSMTSMASASVVGISGLGTFDVYKQYFRPHATNPELVRVSHVVVVLYGAFVAVFSTAIQYGKVSQGWLACESSLLLRCLVVSQAHQATVHRHERVRVLSHSCRFHS